MWATYFLPQSHEIYFLYPKSCRTHIPQLFCYLIYILPFYKPGNFLQILSIYSFLFSTFFSRFVKKRFRWFGMLFKLWRKGSLNTHASLTSSLTLKQKKNLWLPIFFFWYAVPCHLKSNEKCTMMYHYITVLHVASGRKLYLNLNVHRTRNLFKLFPALQIFIDISFSNSGLHEGKHINHLDMLTE